MVDRVRRMILVLWGFWKGGICFCRVMLLMLVGRKLSSRSHWLRIRMRFMCCIGCSLTLTMRRSLRFTMRIHCNKAYWMYCNVAIMTSHSREEPSFFPNLKTLKSQKRFIPRCSVICKHGVYFQMLLWRRIRTCWRKLCYSSEIT